MTEIILPTLFEYAISDAVDPKKTITLSKAEKLFLFFKNCPIFNWTDVHNNCEARAEAVCVLLDKWQIPNYKGWVFSGAFLKNHIGGLKQLWNYHVAALLPVLENGQLQFYMIDPATSDTLQTLDNWAEKVTEYPHSYHIIKLAEYYIFPSGKILKYNWFKRDKQNQKWTIQGLASINGLSGTGKAQLCFRKKKIAITAKTFKNLMHQNPLV